MKAWTAAHPAPAVTIAQVADHIDMSRRSRATTMSESAAISRAWNGRTPAGLNTVSGYPLVFAELIRRGWSDENLAKLAGGNVLRVMRQAEAVAASMKNEPPAMATLEPRPADPGNERATAARGDHSGHSAAAELLARLVHRRRCAARSSIRAATCRGLKAAAEQAEVTIEKILLTHGHIDHCGSAGIFAEELGVPIEGPHEEDRFWIEKLGTEGSKYGINGRPFEPSRWLNDGDQVTVGNLTFDVRHCPGHTPGHIVFHHPQSKLALVGDVLFKGSVGRWDFPRGNQEQLIALDHDEAVADGRRHRVRSGPWADVDLRPRAATNPFVGDAALAA